MHEIAFQEWLLFGVLVLVLLALDLLVFHRRDRAVSLRESAWWSVFEIGTGLAFNAFIWWWNELDAAAKFLATFLVEKSLSMDNIFVFVVLFCFFAIPGMYQYRVLFWGVLWAIFMRLGFILTGVESIHRFEWVIPLFGIFLIYTAYKLMRHGGGEIEPEKNILLRLARRYFRVTTGDHRHYGHDFFVHENGRWCITPMFLALCWLSKAFALRAGGHSGLCRAENAQRTSAAGKPRLETVALLGFAVGYSCPSGCIASCLDNNEQSRQE